MIDFDENRLVCNGSSMKNEKRLPTCFFSGKTGLQPDFLHFHGNFADILRLQALIPRVFGLSEVANPTFITEPFRINHFIYYWLVVGCSIITVVILVFILLRILKINLFKYLHIIENLPHPDSVFNFIL